ncbi:hypothetical protein QCA50_007278 [Cerrena zonata]|uniref:BZIP domain-containing protein n=1 Tax=Cerrena zonata TaxID=2478898 RepID=A0AAW0G9L3_9APHY
MLFSLIIQAYYIALTSILSTLSYSSLTVYSHSAFDLILDIPTVAYFLTPVLKSTANETIVSAAINESTNDVCTWGIPGLLALRPIALSPSVINVPSRELQLYNANIFALSLIHTDSMSCAPLGKYTEDIAPTPMSSSELILIPLSPEHQNPTLLIALRFYFMFGLFLMGWLATEMLMGIYLSQRIRVPADLDESTIHGVVDPRSSDSPAEDAQTQTLDTTRKLKRNNNAQRRANKKAKNLAEVQALVEEAYNLGRLEAQLEMSGLEQMTSSHRRICTL